MFNGIIYVFNTFCHFNGNSPSPLDSIREAVLTVSPNKQYRGILRPTTPATHEPDRQIIILIDFFACLSLRNLQTKMAAAKLIRSYQNLITELRSRLQTKIIKFTM